MKLEIKKQQNVYKVTVEAVVLGNFETSRHLAERVLYVIRHQMHEDLHFYGVKKMEIDAQELA